LTACIRRLLDDPQLYATLAAKGRQRVLDNYTQERIAQQTYDVYKEILDPVTTPNGQITRDHSTAGYLTSQ